MILAIDIGGTKTLVAVFDHDKKIVEQIKFPTPKDYSEFLKSLEETKDKLATKRFFGGAIGIRGQINRDEGLLISDDILQWPGAPLTNDLFNIFSCKFAIENDSNMAGLSESMVEDNKKYKKLLYITLSTGIGSVFIVDGKIDNNLVGSEIGKWIFEHDGKLQTWENFASGKAIVEKYGLKASELTDQKAWEEISRNIALGLINASASYTPDIIIIGGGVGQHFKKFEKPVIKAMQNIVPESVNVPKIKVAKRSEEAVIYGCLELALQKA
ncbi:MAG: ROK family protein [Patescibacteria group bacterium]